MFYRRGKNFSSTQLGSLSGASKLNRQKVYRRKSILILFYVNILSFTCTETFIEKKWRPKDVVRSAGLNTILTKGDKLCRSDKMKEKGFGLLGC